jgi:hypothetical protein
MRSLALVLVALAGLIGSGGCGGGAEPLATEAPRPVRPAPATPAPRPAPTLAITVESTRVGAALRLDIVVAGEGAAGGRPFEQPDRWSIVASQADRPLNRLVNGSTEVERVENSESGWDSVVRFNMVFELGDSSPVTVVLTPPDGAPVTREIEPGEAPEPEPGAPDPAEEAAKAKEAKALADAKQQKAKKAKKAKKKKPKKSKRKPS